MSSEKEIDDALEYFDSICDLNGIACSTVSNGHMIKIKVSYLKELLAKYSDKPELILFIELPNFKN